MEDIKERMRCLNFLIFVKRFRHSLQQLDRVTSVWVLDEVDFNI